MLIIRFGCALISGLIGAVCQFFLNYDETMRLVHFGVVEIKVIEKPYIYVLPHVNHLPSLYIYVLTF